MTEGELEKAQELLDRLKPLEKHISDTHLPHYLNIQRFKGYSGSGAHEYETLHYLTIEHGQLILELIDKWKHEEIENIKQELSDLGVSLGEQTNA